MHQGTEDGADVTVGPVPSVSCDRRCVTQSTDVLLLLSVMAKYGSCSTMNFGSSSHRMENISLTWSRRVVDSRMCFAMATL